MREVVFLNRNAEKWKQFEADLAHSRKADPDRLADLYVELMDDLSYAKTFFPGSKTITYLNSLAARVHQKIYKNKREEKGRLIRFWKEDVPLLMYSRRKELYYSFVLMLLSVAIGVISAANDEGYIRSILGDGYVNMTIANIRHGDPLAVYKSEGGVNMFLWIPFHNIQVALATFAYGITLSIGTVIYIAMNGIMLGSFLTLFYRYNVLNQALLTVWIHGTLEISAIVVAGCAGLTLGNSILFPGTYTRLQSFRRGAAEGMKIAIGLSPVLVVAGFLESFITRHTEWPFAIHLAIILLSLAFVIGYFVLYPLHLHRRTIDGARAADHPQNP